MLAAATSGVTWEAEGDAVTMQESCLSKGWMAHHGTTEVSRRLDNAWSSDAADATRSRHGDAAV